ncbi:MAG: Dihydrofolate reductase type 3 [Candidatus Ordinivivax streblomastigis]|uniref:Dihydrofolate reductase n=1 Tax=Candidatus Ordinivivax streblomastigis TaxID=2540710 RepID=A0A5M8P1M1_9BACT|nr:MAG: Dihydrofolate reductase type 3 [Candidatus Ordinivivax streblomastigis]
MILSIIVAIGKNNEIGKDNAMLCHLPADLKHFKEVTSGHPVIMGRKTFESLPKGPLPNRRNIVISRNKELRIEGAEVYPSLDYALLKLMDEEEIFIIGGAQIYTQILPDADKLYLTKIQAEFPEADTFFPAIHYREWREVSREVHWVDERNPYAFMFVEYER